MSDYRALHLPHDLPPAVETPDLPGAGGPAPRGKAAERPGPQAPAPREKPAAGKAGDDSQGDS